MLLGDHAVVYNRPCLVTAVEPRLRIKMQVIDQPEVRVKAEDVGITDYVRPLSQFKEVHELPKNLQFLEVAVQMMYSRFNLKAGIAIETVNGDFGHYGLGSSSAISVGIVKGLSVLFNLKLKKKEIFDIAYQTVLEVQGVGSGFDVAAAIWGGTLFFVTGGQVIEPLSTKTVPLVVAYSGSKGNTAEIVKMVASWREKDEDGFDKLFDRITRLVEQAKEATIRKDWEELGRLMNLNQKRLDELGVSTETLHKLCIHAGLAGAWGAKLSGAGGGDCMIALVPENHRLGVEIALHKAGGEVLPVKTGAEGVRIEKTP